MALYTDADFPPVDASLGGTYAASSWRRFVELWPREVIPSPTAVVPIKTVVQQGSTLGDCWLLSPLAALSARQPSLIRKMFIRTTAEDVKLGRVRIMLCPYGDWTEVVIDTLIPCNEARRPLFCGTNGAGWAALVEKAFAKYHTTRELNQSPARRPPSCPL